jgi:hypothetical protein
MEPAKKVSKKRPASGAGKKTVTKESVPLLTSVIPAPSLGLYRRIAGAFVFLVALAFVVVLFVSTTKATISITPSVQAVERSFLVDVSSNADEGEAVRGVVLRRTFERAESFPTSAGEPRVAVGKSGGIVTITNETNRDQPLVATTRLLSLIGVLFRLDDGVIVPAHGSVEVSAHADEEGSAGDIGPDHFTIPGLSMSLQDVIYATSAEAMRGGERSVRVLSQDELDAAEATLEASMLEDAKAQLRAEIGEEVNASGEAYHVMVAEKTSDTMPGEETEQFSIMLTLEMTGVFFDRERVAALSDAKLYEMLEKGFSFVDISREPVVTVQAANPEDQTAQLQVTRTAVSVVSLAHPTLDLDTFVGKREQEVRDRLVSAGLAQDVSVRIFPPWVRAVPALKDHIEVKILRP